MKSPTGRAPSPHRGLRLRALTVMGMGALVLGMGADAVAAGSDSVAIQSPPKVRAKKKFAYTLSAASANPAATVWLFVRPGTRPCGPTAGVERSQGGQGLVTGTAINGQFSQTRFLKPVKGSSIFCAYTEPTADAAAAPLATSSSVFVAKRKRRR